MNRDLTGVFLVIIAESKLGFPSITCGYSNETWRVISRSNDFPFKAHYASGDDAI